VAESAIAKIFMHRRSQAGLLLEPIWDAEAMKAFWTKIDALSGGAFLPEGHPEQPPMPIDDRKYFDE